jgi:hypothetical protein
MTLTPWQRQKIEDDILALHFVGQELFVLNDTTGSSPAVVVD